MMIRPLFQYQQVEAANILGIAPCSLRQACQRLGMGRWPWRQLGATNPSDSITQRHRSSQRGRVIQNIHTHADDAAGSASGYHTDTGGKACSICRQTQTEADFSNAQWVARAKTRTCNKCFDEAWKTDVYDRVKLARRACRSNAPDA